jgi:hypothetical protein
VSEHDPSMAPRFELRVAWERGEKRFAVHDLLQQDAVVGIFDTAKEASIQCAILWLEHLRALRCGRTMTPDLILMRPERRLVSR